MTEFLYDCVTEFLCSQADVGNVSAAAHLFQAAVLTRCTLQYSHLNDSDTVFCLLRLGHSLTTESCKICSESVREAQLLMFDLVKHFPRLQLQLSTY